MLSGVLNETIRKIKNESRQQKGSSGLVFSKSSNNFRKVNSVHSHKTSTQNPKEKKVNDIFEAPNRQGSSERQLGVKSQVRTFLYFFPLPQ